jgi:hypothetical protein
MAPTATRTVDSVPEYYHYEDTGCEISPACLSCPLPQCKYDDPVWFQKHRRIARDLKMWSAIRAEGLSVEEAADRFSVTVRTVFRIMQRCREAINELDAAVLEALAAVQEPIPSASR